MLKKLVLYSIAAIAVGIITMIIPIGLIMLLSKTRGTALTQETYTEEETQKTLTRGYGSMIDRFREVARFYGGLDVTEGDEAADGKSSLTRPLPIPYNILASLMIVVSAGLLAALIAKMIIWLLGDTFK